MTPLESAVRLVEAGLVVFPVGLDKKPLVPWSTEKATNPEEAARLFATRPHAAGVAIDDEASGIASIDFDFHKSGGTELGRWFMDYGDEWQDTAVTRTQTGGTHYHFLDPDGRCRTTVGSKRLGIAPGVDTRGIGGYVVAPDSRGEHGSYSWVPGCSPWERAIAPLPEWLPGLIRTTSPSRKRRPGEREGASIPSPNILGLGIPPSLSGFLSGDVLRGVVRDEQTSRYLASYIGVPDVPVGAGFRCILRDDDEHPSASLFRKSDDSLWYRDWTQTGGELEWLTLGEAYAAVISGTTAKLDGPSHATWLRRLLVDSRLAHPAPVPMRALPIVAPAALRRLHEGIRHLFACKWLGEPDAPSPLTRRFLSGWCGLSEMTIQKYLHKLVRDGYLVVDGTVPSTYGPMKVYRPVASRMTPAEAGRIGKTLATVAQYDKNRPWWNEKESKKEQQQHGNENDLGQLDLDLAKCGGD
jgi:hypothetical protein